MAITAALVKELRDRTSAGMMDCKESPYGMRRRHGSGDHMAARKGIAKAAKKAGRIAAEGLTRVVTDGNRACLIEVNSETDFVARTNSSWI